MIPPPPTFHERDPAPETTISHGAFSVAKPRDEFVGDEGSCRVEGKTALCME